MLFRRAHYTPEEDDAIVDYVERHKKENCVKGNKIWKDMEAEKVTICLAILAQWQCLLLYCKLTDVQYSVKPQGSLTLL